MTKRAGFVTAACVAAVVAYGLYATKPGSCRAVDPPPPAGRASAGVEWPTTGGATAAGDAATRAVIDALAGVPSLDGDLARQLRRQDLPLAQRRRIVWEMVRSGDPGHFQILTEYLSSGDGEAPLMATILEALGSSRLPEAGDWLVSALQADDETLVAAALRGIGQLGRSEDVGRLIQMFETGGLSVVLQAEVIDALGGMKDPLAGKWLMDGYRGSADEAYREQVLAALGKRDIAETGGFFRGLMAASDDPEFRAGILERLTEATGDVAGFLLQFIGDADPGVRAEAVWSLSMLDGDHRRELALWLQSEQDGEVRMRIYQALAGQPLGDVGGFFALAGQEVDPAAQMAGYGLVAASLGEIAGRPEQAAIQQQLIGYFEQAALRGEVQAVVHLKQMDGEAVRQSLQRIAAASPNPRVVEATGFAR